MKFIWASVALVVMAATAAGPGLVDPVAREEPQLFLVAERPETALPEAMAVMEVVEAAGPEDGQSGSQPVSSLPPTRLTMSSISGQAPQVREVEAACHSVHPGLPDSQGRSSRSDG